MAATSASRTVRRVVPEDWSALRELRLRALTTDPLAFGSTVAREAAYPDELWKERTERAALSATSSQWIAATPSGRLVGTAVVAEMEGRLHVFAMWVEPEFRNAGLGRRLLDSGLRWAEEKFAGRDVHLEVNPGQAAAVRLYESRGFRFVGEPRPIGHTPGVFVRPMIRKVRDVRSA